MKIWSTLSLVALTVAMVFTGADAEAKRMGGGKSVGKQSSNVTQREAAPAAAKPAAPAAAPAAAAPKRPWGAMLGGLAAGLGLAWLASSLGFGEGMAQFMTFALAALAIMLVVGFVLRYLKSRREGAGQTSESPFAFQGAGASPAPGYSPANVGNDASARPWERASTAFEASPAANGTAAQGGSMIGSALLGAQTWGVPAGFDSEGFLAACKTNFVTLQGAWDRSDISALREMMTDEMLDQIKTQLAERESHTGGTVNKTDVLRLDAQLLGIEETTEVYLASVEFSGMIREDESAGPSPFREVWNMSKPRHGAGGWLVAGVQALQ
ncbi:MAG: TIM44-like domain-containing protein [Rhodoferax sp.]|nr:TIM44-like domain-containing protein [Rhodoferax sp.]